MDCLTGFNVRGIGRRHGANCRKPSVHTVFFKPLRSICAAIRPIKAWRIKVAYVDSTLQEINYLYFGDSVQNQSF